MAESVAERGDRGGAGRHGGADTAATASADSFAELRAIIVGPEQRELRALQNDLRDSAVQTRNVSRVLPDAIALRSNDSALTRALAPSIEEAITASVRKDPRPLADALFPVIGPAIRKAVAHTIAAMVESVNRSLEQRMSWRAVQWRWTAWRTGKPFAEIVLLNTLQYRVDEVFLIHRDSGLLLQYVSATFGAGQDADQISAMLTAIRDFVRDSFTGAGGDSIESLRIGELSIFVEQGPIAILAGVVRGAAPHSVRVLFQNALESVHRQLGPELASFDGDAAAFERAKPILETCLVSQRREPARPLSYRPYRRWLMAGAVVLVAIGIWAFLIARDRGRWNSYVDRLNAEPGIVVLSSGRRAGKFFVTGLRDPLATDPAGLFAASTLSPAAVESRWEPYQALHDPFVAARANNLLQPPAGVSLTYHDGVLTAGGVATARWLVDAERLAPAIAGVRQFAYAGTPPEIRLKEQIEAMTIVFPKAQAVIAPGQQESLETLARLFRELNETLRVRDRRGQVEIVGHTDIEGSETLNQPLSAARANAVLQVFRNPMLDALDFVVLGVGNSLPLTPDTSEREQARNRRTSFRVQVAGNSPVRSPRQ